jgi:hypothetical protein
MSRKADAREARHVVPPERVEEIRALLERVLSSHQFRGSRRCQSLLRHITEQTLAADTSSLKERTLGIDVFGRAPDYDTNQDPVVRATAAEIRGTNPRHASTCSRGPTSPSFISTSARGRPYRPRAAGSGVPSSAELPVLRSC